MARIPYPDIDHPDYAPLAERVRRERAGWVGNIHKLIMHSPPGIEGNMHLLTAIRQQANLDGRYRELAILMVAVINGADYEFNAHAPFAIKAGVREAHVDALKRGEKAPGLSPADLAVLNYAEAMTKTIRVPDEVFAAVRRHFDDRSLVELSLTIGAYNMVSRFLEALQVDHDYPAR